DRPAPQDIICDASPVEQRKSVSEGKVSHEVKLAELRHVAARTHKSVPVVWIDWAGSGHVLGPYVRPLESVVPGLFAQRELQCIIAAMTVVERAADAGPEKLERPAWIDRSRAGWWNVQVPTRL